MGMVKWTPREARIRGVICAAERRMRGMPEGNFSADTEEALGGDDKP